MAIARSVNAYRYDEILNNDISYKILKFEKKAKAKEIKSKIINRTLVALIIILVFTVMSYVVMRYAEINEIKYNNFNFKTEVELLNVQIEELKFKAESALNLDNVEKYAIDKLGMQYPKEEQIVYLIAENNYAINVDNNDKILDNDNVVIEVIKTEKKSVFALIFDSFRD